VLRVTEVAAIAGEREDDARGSRTRVLVVDDQVAFAESLAMVIGAQDDLDCVGWVGSGEEAVELAASERPSVVLMDVALPGIDGVEATRQVREVAPDVDVVVLTGTPDASVLARSASAGACAFLLKDSSVSEILEAVRTAHRGGGMGLDAATIGHLLDDGGTAAEAALTQRELEVLGLLARGQQPKEIARSLGITVNTCRGYVKNVLAKLGAHSALEAVVEAHRLGLITLPSRS
jgi:DNA-binding NarL/FixJ family response regulator